MSIDILDLFNSALLQEQTLREVNEKLVEKKPIEEEKIDDCNHESVSTIGKLTVCDDCNAEIDLLTHNQEWRYYGGRSSGDPNRCHPRRQCKKDIHSDIEGMNFPQPIITKANEFYFLHTEGYTRRGANRKSIICACVFYAYKADGSPRNVEQLQLIFNLSRKSVSKGIKQVSLTIRRNTRDAPTYVTPVTLIPDIMKKFNAKEAHINEVIKIYNAIRNYSSLINRSKPQSVASSVVYYYILKTSRKIPSNIFLEKVGLSDSTVTKITKEICSLLDDVEISAML